MPRTDVVMRRLGLTKEKLIEWAKENYPHVISEEKLQRLNDGHEIIITKSTIKDPPLTKVLLTQWLHDHGARHVTPNWWKKKISEVEEEFFEVSP